MTKERLCPECGKDYKNRGKLCSPCYGKAYYLKNIESTRLRKAKYRIANREKLNEKGRLYSELNRKKIRLKNRVYYSNNKVDILSYQKKIKLTPKRKFGQGKKSALERELEWELSFDEYKDIICNSCHYCSDDLAEWGGTSLDRIDNEVGYILTNVLPCCGNCNKIRNTFLTVEEMEVAMAAVLKLREDKLLKQGEACGNQP